jgi:hypothetical protein
LSGGTIFVLLALWGASLYVELQKSHSIERRVKVIERFITVKGKPGPRGKQGKPGTVRKETITDVITKIVKANTIPGPRGFRGYTGKQGSRGVQGPRGFTGSRGIQGTKGDKGNTGQQGPAGPIGPAGTTTLTCPTGFTWQTVILRLNPQGAITVAACVKQ